ncbi:MAG TPA: sugar phosphate isomerase/epimerase [Tepidisphaeraceae bacterium]|jgi:sugar phosphate isomerase/epimerase
MSSLPISIQLYTVRDLTAKDFAGTMKKIAAIGYKNVELAGFGNLKTAAEVKKALDDAGLKPSGIHAGIDSLNSDLNKVMDDCAAIGIKNIICPWLPDERRKGAEVWKKTASELNAAGKKCVAKGFEFAYHNHDFEFHKIGNQTALDILWENTEPGVVKSELDVFWVKFAGVDPVSYMQQLGKRCILVHLKDMNNANDKKFAPVGTGILDFKAICDECTKLGVKYGIVEQDDCYGADPLEAIKVSLENLKRLGMT